MRILFATDGSRGAAIAEEFLLSLPLSCADEVTLVTVPTVSERESYALLSRCRWRFAARDIPTTTILRDGHASDVAQCVALERASDLLVIGSRGRGEWTGALLGSVARALAHDGVTPLLVVRSRREAPRGVLLAIDGSSEARAAVDLLARLPLPSIARIDILRVEVADHAELSQRRIIEHARVVLGGRIGEQDVLARGHIGEGVVRRALDSDTDLIVLGTEGQTVGAGLLNSSIADHVVTHAHCAVLIAKTPLQARLVVAPVLSAVAALR